MYFLSQIASLAGVPELLNASHPWPVFVDEMQKAYSSRFEPLEIFMAAHSFESLKKWWR